MLCLNDQKKVQDYRTCYLTNDRCMYMKTAKSKYTGEISFLSFFLLFTKYSNICISYVRNKKRW